MPELPELTVVVTTRNRADLLEVALRSVRTSLGEGTRVIIGDNGNAEPTRALLARHDQFGLQVQHRINPAGSSYTDNVQILIDACETPWLTLLHDDDFFTGPTGQLIAPTLRDAGVAFAFSDHWVAANDGTLDEAQTQQNSERYGRARLAPGRVPDLARLAIENSICLDGFFVRTSVARGRRLDRSLPLFAENKWMIEICSDCGHGVFLRERLFAYRVTAGSLTSQGMNNVEILEAMLRTEVPPGPNRRALAARTRAEWWSAFKWSVKRRRMFAFLGGHSPLALLSRS